MQTAWAEGRVGEAMAIQNRLLPLHDALFSETSPGPVKYAASLLGRTSESAACRWRRCAEATKARVRAAMGEAGLLN